MVKRLFILFIFVTSLQKLNAQCSAGITSYPYQQGFEVNNGNWTAGGTGSSWEWGTPAKPVITAAASGSKCWVIGGLTGSSYTNGEASWLQSPCFDFTALQYPYIKMKVFWEMEQQFDGASFQYSTDNGNTWTTLGAMNEPLNCLQTNWYNNGSINYLSPLTATKQGWSGNKQTSSGSCRGGSGSGGWVEAAHLMPSLAGNAGVVFRFIFGAGTICNNYDGFAVDDIWIGEAPPNEALFIYSCANALTVDFTNTSLLCPTGYRWDFDDPASAGNNTATTANPSHTFSAPGTYAVTLTVDGPGNAPSTISKDITVISVTATTITDADCNTNLGGSVRATVIGTTDPVTYTWNTSPVQQTQTASNLGAGSYMVTVDGNNICPATATTEVKPDVSCSGIFFPSGFTPNNDGKNDSFGPIGSLAVVTNYRLSIYNRWGQRVFYSTNPFEKWDGKIKGLVTDNNLFIWYAAFTLPGQPNETRKGTLMLIR